ncbi:MAG: class I SAM-dependent methyltransferase [Deltaproteobacteria bacterium]|nr:class I SAM-dependent methyltransferase [Deltaproteobacteria bacterium]
MSALCRLCSSPGTTTLFESRDRIHGFPGKFTIIRCRRCRALFIEPWLTERELAAYYPEYYGRYRRSRSLDRKSYKGIKRFVLENAYGYPPREEGRSSVLRRAAALLLSLVMAKDAIPYRGEGRFLDIGCGGGSYLYRLRQWGWEVHGVEPSRSGVAQARSLGLEVHHGRVRDAKFPDRFFDVIRLHHVLEHLTEPNETLREIARILKPDGVVTITVPNTRSLNFWLFQENWYGLDAPRHVISYCPEALRLLCDATGFAIAGIRFRSGAFNFVRSVKFLMQEKGQRLPEWLHGVDWAGSRLIRRTLKPLFFLVDFLRLGDIMEATLEKRPGI